MLVVVIVRRQSQTVLGTGSNAHSCAVLQANKLNTRHTVAIHAPHNPRSDHHLPKANGQQAEDRYQAFAERVVHGRHECTTAKVDCST